MKAAEKILTELREIAAEMAEHAKAETKLKRRRLALWRRGRKLNVSTAELAEAAGMKSGDVRQYLWRADNGKED